MRPKNILNFKKKKCEGWVSFGNALTAKPEGCKSIGTQA